MLRKPSSDPEFIITVPEVAADYHSPRPIRGQYPGHVITLNRGQLSGQVFPFFLHWELESGKPGQRTKMIRANIAVMRPGLDFLIFC